MARTQTTAQKITDPEPTEASLNAARALLEEYGAGGVLEIMAGLLLETAEEFPADRLTADKLDSANSANGTQLRWPELRRRLAR